MDETMSLMREKLTSFFWPRINPGGILVFDDWEWERCPGVRRAIDEAGLKVSVSARYQCFAVREAF